MSERRGCRHELVLQIEAGMIRTECNTHQFRAVAAQPLLYDASELPTKLALDPPNEAS
jgi:hypothetical protein